VLILKSRNYTVVVRFANRQTTLMDNMHLINLIDQLNEIQKTKKININNQE